MYRVRFHLAKGEHYMKWQVRSGDNSIITYFDPEKYFFVMRNCKLINKKVIAEKIYCGANKSVCAWIECEKLEAIEEQFFNLKVPPDEYYPVIFNPKVKPFWKSGSGKNIDNSQHDVLITYEKSILSKTKV